MTTEEFFGTCWKAGMKVHCKFMKLMLVSQTAYVVAVNFDQCLIATAPDPDCDAPDEWTWWRCESCELVE